MAVAPGVVRIEGLRDLMRAFRVMPVEVAEELKWELEEAVEPVRLAAQAKAPGSMRNMTRTREWAAMKTGVSRRDATVWVAPQLTGGRKKWSQRGKDNFALRMQTKALDPALKENIGHVTRRIEQFLDRVGNHNGF